MPRDSWVSKKESIKIIQCTQTYCALCTHIVRTYKILFFKQIKMKCEGKAKQKLIEIRARRISHHFLFSDMAEALFSHAILLKITLMSILHGN